MKMNRRQAIKTLAAASGAVLCAPMLNFGRFQLFAAPLGAYSARCLDLMQRSLVIDMLSQFKLGAFAEVLGNTKPDTTWFTKPETFTADDLQKYRDSGITVFQIGWGTRRASATDSAEKEFAAWHKFVGYHNKNFEIVQKVPELGSVKSSGKIGIILGLQGSDHFRTANDVAYFYGLGQRVSQLTYNDTNLIGSGYMARPDRGITHFGDEIIHAMDKAGMAIDLSHCGDKTTADTMATSLNPVLFTHADCRALVPHPRNKSDEQLKKLAAKGGVIGITGVAKFAKRGAAATLEDVLDHFDHAVKVAGIDHVGVGSDMDLEGYDKLPTNLRKKMFTGYKKQNAGQTAEIEGLNHPKRMFDLTEGLIRRGYTDAHITAILGGNWKRVLAQIWK
jgi:membrane dipeptidase